MAKKNDEPRKYEVISDLPGAVVFDIDPANGEPRDAVSVLPGNHEQDLPPSVVARFGEFGGKIRAHEVR